MNPTPLQPILTVRLLEAGFVAEAMPVESKANQAGRAVVVRIRRDPSPDSEPALWYKGILICEEDPGRLGIVHLVWTEDGWQIQGVNERPKVFLLLNLLRIAAEVGWHLKWPLWEMYFQAQSRVGWRGDEIVQVVRVSKEEATRIMLDQMGGQLPPAEA